MGLVVVFVFVFRERGYASRAVGVGGTLIMSLMEIEFFFKKKLVLGNKEKPYPVSQI